MPMLSVHRRCRRRLARGQTLVELLIVMAIMLVVITMIACALSRIYHAVQSFRH
jgi:prepilin-type N-terminal cleavage/methylation domain-containing protein